MASLALFEIILRGITVGAALLIAGVLLRGGLNNRRRALGALFTVGNACYVLVSSPQIAAACGPFLSAVLLLSIFAPIFFWWFALALFDDDFRWRWPIFIPLALVAPIVAASVFAGPGVFAWNLGGGLLRLTFAFIYGHAIYTALRFLSDDLIEGRRRFRVVFAIVVAITGLVITYAETVGFGRTPSQELLVFHAAAILVLTFGFGVWMLSARAEVLDGPAAPARPQEAALTEKPPVRAADRPAYDTLMRLMAEGAWREENLTVAGLAAKVGAPEHHLRRLINQALGFRNFSAFLNSYRIDGAKAALADPAEVRKQVLQIALDLGYGSITPFNRAFKEATGKTPTEFRKGALGDA